MIFNCFLTLVDLFHHLHRGYWGIEITNTVIYAARTHTRIRPYVDVRCFSSTVYEHCWFLFWINDIRWSLKRRRLKPFPFRMLNSVLKHCVDCFAVWGLSVQQSFLPSPLQIRRNCPSWPKQGSRNDRDHIFRINSILMSKARRGCIPSSKWGIQPFLPLSCITRQNWVACCFCQAKRYGWKSSLNSWKKEELLSFHIGRDGVDTHNLIELKILRALPATGKERNCFVINQSKRLQCPLRFHEEG